ncbi:MAG: pilus assembly protein TadG-related protein [Pseudomonadota bacterium]
MIELASSHGQPVIASIRRRRESGSVLVYALAMMLAVALVVMMVFNTGQLTSEKIKLHNTADAVAFSISTVEARSLNYMSYTNRAIVANHASMAQMISFVSVMRMADSSVGNISLFADMLTPVMVFIPGLNVAWTAFGRAMNVVKGVTTALTAVLKAVSLAIVEVTYGLEQAIFASQIAMAASTIESLPETYVTVLKANDATAHFSALNQTVALAAAASEAGAFVKPYKRPTRKVKDEETEKYERFTKLAEELRDEFTKRRAIFPPLDIIKDFIPFQIDGGTELTQFADGHYGWTAMDTLGFKVPIIGALLPKIPIGGSAIQLGSNETITFKTVEQRLWAALGTGSKDEEKYLAMYGGQRWKPAVKAWWPSPVDVVPEKEKIDGALVHNAETVEATLLPLPPNFKGVEVIGGNIELPRYYFDVRTSSQLYADNYEDKNGKGYSVQRSDLDLVDVLDGPIRVDRITKGGWNLFDPNSDIGPSILIPLSKPMNSVRTTSTIGIGKERAALPESKELRVIGKGQVYFKAPLDRWPRKDLVVEHRSLFNPYWNARLVHPRLWERLLNTFVE